MRVCYFRGLMSKFSDFPLSPSLQKALTALQFFSPTPIQTKAIPLVLDGKDVVGLAQTGTGKTGAFAIPLIERLLREPHSSCLVLAPTRELAMQIHAFVKGLLGKNTQLRAALLIGGASMHMQNVELRRHPRMLIATPGRLVDHLRSHAQLLRRTNMLVLDEADRMLDMGFLPQLKVVLRALPQQRQTLMFSATFAPEVKTLSAQFLRQPVEVSVGEVSRPVQRIEQQIIQTTQKDKNEILLDELNARQGSILVFTRTKLRTDRLAKYLLSYGYEVARIHGDRTLAQRRNAIEGFRGGQFRILVATDIAARGLDIADIAHVINYDLPQVAEDYVHRIGRTARNGKGGRALCLLTPEDRQLWRAISKINPGAHAVSI